MDGHSGVKLVVKPSCLDTEGIDSETGTEPEEKIKPIIQFP